MDMLFIHEDLPESFRNLFFGPMEPNETFHVFTTREQMGHIMHRAGIFPSASQAMKNGWKKPVPVGFSHVQHKKTRQNIFILNTFSGFDED